MDIRWVPIGCHGKKIQKNKWNASILKRETLLDMGIWLFEMRTRP